MSKQTKTEATMMANTQRPDSLPGHKCQGAKIGFEVKCECGFTTGTWCGKDARKNAYGEWRSHIREHQARGKDNG
ncbi:hypothetical protein LCGC14_1853130 [marine sediment metagenome]|uniref:Uncharacterized protein n=1 Tax=marine sediment metagenome TaxID=412755 RepID=A0A0F9J8X8_9ZZZZ